MRFPGYRHVSTVALVAVLASIPLAARAQGGGMVGRGRMGMGMGGGMMGDSTAAAVMPTVHELMMNHAKLRRTVTNLPNGVRTVTESDDSTTVAQLQAHVAATGVLMAQSRDLNVPPASPTLRQLLQRGAQVTRVVEHTRRGVVVTETSADSTAVTLLQAHAAEVTELVERGMPALHEKMQQRMRPPRD
jgi:hypothetical protein